MRGFAWWCEHAAPLTACDASLRHGGVGDSLAHGVPAIAVRVGRDRASAAWLVLASPFTLAHGIAGAHRDLAVAGLLCLAVLLALCGSWVTGTVLAAAAVKAPAVVLARPVHAHEPPLAPLAVSNVRRWCHTWSRERVSW